ncbi:hypothetical protein GCM10023331_38720 [Algivirga pacifica]|uniref:EamA domain-containing protein n=2 Tax=Algivirga pacifica TaxID=1162670 RepID=A0ABP9DLN5_9BACT
MIVTALLISFNWGIYIWGVNSGHTVDVSLGYFINPLVSVFLGMIFFKERLSPLKWIALVLALMGVGYQTYAYGQLPWIAVCLALSFGLYGMFKKKYAMDSMGSLMGETMLITPLALGTILYLSFKGESGLFTLGATTDIMLLLSGIVTSVPLFLFAEGAKKIPLSAVGFLQYIAPSLMLSIGVFFFGENFTETDAISFTLIWCGLLIYTYAAVRGYRKQRKQKVARV